MAGLKQYLSCVLSRLPTVANGEQTANSAILPDVYPAARAEELDRPLTPEQLRQLEHSLALLFRVQCAQGVPARLGGLPDRD